MTLDLVDDVLIDVFIVMIDTGIDGISICLDLKVQVVYLGDKGVESLSV